MYITVEEERVVGFILTMVYNNLEKSEELTANAGQLNYMANRSMVLIVDHWDKDLLEKVIRNMGRIC